MNFVHKTAEYYYKINFIVFFLGSPNFWIEDLGVSKLFYSIYRGISKFLNIIVPVFIIFELGGFITQKSLSKKQESDIMIYGISHPILWSYSLIMWSHEGNMKKLYSQMLKLKNIYNDEQVEEMMLRKAKRDSAALAISCVASVLLHTTSAILLFINSEGTFTTVITAWPLVDDPSFAADVVRIICNIVWWVFLSRIIATYIIIIGLATSMSHQYMNLQSYFCRIEAVFEDKHLRQREKEKKYEEAFKLGVQLHSETIECFRQFQNICSGIFSGQVVFVILMLVFLMTQMMKSERTMVNAAATAVTATSVLISTGFVLWNAGDITVEASKLPTAMYLSGWQNCQGMSSYGIRKLVVIAMTHAQKPVVLKGLGIMNLSYQSYVSLVKSSYSVFSVIY